LNATILGVFSVQNCVLCWQVVLNGHPVRVSSSVGHGGNAKIGLPLPRHKCEALANYYLGFRYPLRSSQASLFILILLEVHMVMKNKLTTVRVYYR
jgi:hypothetical protein